MRVGSIALALLVASSPLPARASPQDGDIDTSSPVNLPAPPPPKPFANSSAVAKFKVNCHDPYSGVDSSCWAALDMTNWLKGWWNEHTCHPGEGFSSCFLRFQGMSDVDCTVINAQSCTAQITTKVTDPYVFYVLHNIYAINTFYNSWYQALFTSIQNAELQIDTIVNLLNPNRADNVDLQSILTYLLLGLSFLPGPASIMAAGIGKVAEYTAAEVGTAVVNTPGLMKFLFPVKQEVDKAAKISDLKQQLGNLKDALSSRLGPALNLTQCDLSAFLSLAGNSNGSLSTKPPPSLASQTNSLTLFLNTFVVSTCMRSSNIIGVVAENTDVQQLATNGTRLSYDISCQEYEPYDICNAWWYDRANNKSWTLVNNKFPKDNPYKILKTIFRNGLSSGQALFENAAFCKANASDPGTGIKFETDQGKFNLQCVSQLQVCTWDPACHAGRHYGSRHICEYTDCPPHPKFTATIGRFSSVFNVPAGYLGPLLTSGDHSVKNDGPG